MQLVNHQSGESFAAAIARRMMSQPDRSLMREIPPAEMALLRDRANTLAPGFTVTREAVAEHLGDQQLMAAAAVQRTWPEDPHMQLISRETAAKAGRPPGADAEGDDESGESVRPRG